MKDEIKYHQQNLFDCVSDFLDNNLDKNNGFAENMMSACSGKNDEFVNFYAPYLEKTSLNSKFFNSKVYRKLADAYKNLGSMGYNAHVCQNL